ncbi:MAG TPA: TonB family protein [Terriglobia bacterium]|nr:TonB family protein [Terriglobia bacterium]
MKRVILLAAVLAATFLGFPTRLVAAPTAVIAGRVISRKGEPVRSVFISAATATGQAERMRSVLTDDRGQFRLDNLPPGRYHVVAGYEDIHIFFPGVRDRSRAKVVEVNAGDSVQLEDFVGNVNIVVGHVRVKNNGPLPRLSLALTDAAGETTVAYPDVMADGVFNLLLPDEDWIVRWNSAEPVPEGYSLETLAYGRTNLLVDALKAESVTADRKAAEPPELRVDFSATRGSWAKVNGLITGVNAQARQYYALLTPDANAFLVSLTATVDRNGRFEFPGVLNGNYTLHLVSNGGMPVSRSVAVSGSNVIVNLTAAPHKEVKGRALLEGSAANDFAFVIALKRPGEADAQIIVYPDEAGKFTVALPLGESRLSLLSGQAGSFTYGAVDLEQTALNILQGDKAQELNVRFGGVSSGATLPPLSDGVVGLLGLPQTSGAVDGVTFRPGQGITPPKPLTVTSTPYTDLARKARVSGVAVLDAIVNADGTIRVLRVTRRMGFGLDESAIATVESWKFNPGTRDGKPVAVRVKIEVTFRLI